MFDKDVLMSSIFEISRSKSDEEMMVDVMLSSFYQRFFGGRKYPVRGES